MGYMYVMSDLHGQYEAYIKMLEKIDFSEDDTLYILGDIVDRGPNPIKILKDMMQRTNVISLVGNHELMMCECCKFLLKEITEENIDELDDEMLEGYLNWQENGGNTTVKEFQMLTKEERQQVLDYLMEFEAYEELEVNGKALILVHAGLYNFEPDKEMWEYELYELVWNRTDYEKKYFEDKYVISGHTPTCFISGAKPGAIYQANNHIAIDCGAGVPGGTLGCIRLEDMKEFYVDI